MYYRNCSILGVWELCLRPILGSNVGRCSWIWKTSVDAQPCTVQRHGDLRLWRRCYWRHGCSSDCSKHGWTTWRREGTIWQTLWIHLEMCRVFLVDTELKGAAFTEQVPVVKKGAFNPRLGPRGTQDHSNFVHYINSPDRYLRTVAWHKKGEPERWKSVRNMNFEKQSTTKPWKMNEHGWTSYLCIFDPTACVGRERRQAKALHMAARAGHAELCRILLNHRSLGDLNRPGTQVSASIDVDWLIGHLVGSGGWDEVRIPKCSKVRIWTSCCCR